MELRLTADRVRVWRRDSRWRTSPKPLRVRRRPLAGLVGVVGLLSGGLVVAVAPPASAVFPGANGKIAFASQRDGNSEIYTINPDGSGLARLTQHPAADTSPKWSPDGSWIAFGSRRSGNSDIYLMRSDGSLVRSLTNDPSDDQDPSWSPDGLRIVFSSSRGGKGAELYSLSIATGAVTRLTTDACIQFPTPGVADPTCVIRTNNNKPTWAPDGRQIAFIKAQGTGSTVYLVNADGSGQRRLVDAFHAHYVDWSPDGQRLVYDDHSQSVQVVNRDGTGNHVVPLTRRCPATGNCFVLSMPGWSPDGTKLAAVTAITQIAAPGIYILSPDGTNQVRILADSTIGDAKPHWQALRRPVLPPGVDGTLCSRLQPGPGSPLQSMLQLAAAAVGCPTASAAATSETAPITPLATATTVTGSSTVPAGGAPTSTTSTSTTVELVPTTLGPTTTTMPGTDTPAVTTTRPIAGCDQLQKQVDQASVAGVRAQLESAMDGLGCPT